MVPDPAMGGAGQRRGDEVGALDAGRGPGIRVPPPVVYVAGFLVGAGFEFVVPTPSLPPAFAIAVGVIGVAVWVTLDPVSMWRFRDAGTEVPPSRPATRMVRSGPYRVSRNPMYLGMLVLSGAGALALGTLWVLVVLPVVFVVIDRRVIRREEAYLERAFGEEYRTYRRRVRRWL